MLLKVSVLYHMLWVNSIMSCIFGGLIYFFIMVFDLIFDTKIIDNKILFIRCSVFVSAKYLVNLFIYRCVSSCVFVHVFLSMQK